MTEINVPAPIAEVKATHFSSENKTLFNPPKEQPGLVLAGPAQPEKKGWFNFFKQQKTEVLPVQPEGPKHVLENLQVVDAIKRYQEFSAKLEEPMDNIRYQAYSSSLKLGGQVNLDGVRAVQENIAVGRLAQTPLEIQKVYDLLNEPNAEDRISGFNIGGRGSPQEIILQSANGIRIRLGLPLILAGEYPENYLSLKVECTKSINASQKEALKSIEDTYANKDRLLEMMETMVSYSEGVADVLPGVAEAILKKESKQSEWREQVEKDQAFLFQKLAEKIEKGRQTRRQSPKKDTDEQK